MSFSGLNAEVIDISTSAGTFLANCDVQLSLENPQGSTIAGPVCAGQAGSLPQTTLTADGTYKIVVAPTPTVTGSLKLSLKSTGAIKSITPNAKGIRVSVPAGASISFGTIVPNNVKLTALAISSTGFSGCLSYQITILKPDNTQLATNSRCNNDTAFIDAVAGAGAGTYKLKIDNLGPTKGTTTLSIYAFKDQTATITPSPAGGVVTIKKNFPGQNAVISFSGSSGQKISATVTNASGYPDCYDLTLFRPDGSGLAGTANCGTNNAFMDATTLDQNGTWTLVFSPRSTDTGTATVTTYLVNDQIGSITKGGASKTVTITTPGQNARFTFSGTSGTNETATITGAAFSGSNCYSLAFLRPDGSTLTSGFFCGATGAIGPIALDASGTWTILVDISQTETGTATLTLT